jgi:tRNA (cmo5U34)-methyltransferase
MPNEHLTGHGNPWRQRQHALDWIANTDASPPRRGEELDMLLAFLPWDRDSHVNLLELGAGHGLLTSLVLERFPHADVLALDLSPVMLQEGQKRLAGYGERVSFVEWDLEQPGWPSNAPGPFDGVVSSLAIHHLARHQKQAVSREVLRRLTPGGILINLDYVSPPSDALADRYIRTQAAPTLDGQRPHLAGGHATDTLFDQLDDLRHAGFVDVDVFWKRMSLALFGGSRPA